MTYYSTRRPIVTLGHFYPQGQVDLAQNILREVNTRGYRTDGAADAAKED